MFKSFTTGNLGIYVFIEKYRIMISHDTLTKETLVILDHALGVLSISLNQMKFIICLSLILALLFLSVIYLH